MKLAAIVVFIGVLSIVYAQIYALWDVVVRQSAMSWSSRTLWVVGLLVFPVLGTVVYLRMGPGADHWPPWDVTDES